jgi:hypothetical protein
MSSCRCRCASWRDGQVLARGRNLGSNGDPTAHGEMMAIRRSPTVGPSREKHRLRDRRQEPRIHSAGHHSQKVQPVLIPCVAPSRPRQSPTPTVSRSAWLTASKHSFESYERGPSARRCTIRIRCAMPMTISPTRNIDSKRLVKKIVHLDADILAVIKKEASRVIFG